MVKNYSSKNIQEIMSHLNKSYISVRRKAAEMELTRSIYEDGLFYSTMEVMDILGLAKSTVRYYAKQGYLQHTTMKSFDKTYLKFSCENIIEFMSKYPEKWAHRNYDKDFLNILFIDYVGNIENIEKIKEIIGEGSQYWRKKSSFKMGKVNKELVLINEILETYR